MDVYALLLLLAILAYFGVIMGVFFELYRVADYLLVHSWNVPGEFPLRMGCLGVVAWLVVRLAWRLAVSLVGLLTPRLEQADILLEALELDGGLEGGLGGDQAELYHLVDEVAGRVQAPRPDSIRVTHIPETFVIETRRFGFRTQRTLTLVLGLPQLAVLTTDELRVILAHELGHFRQRDTTVAIFLYRFIESLRRAVDSWQNRWWRWGDPIFLFCWSFYQFFRLAAAPIQRTQELRADRVSALAFGGNLAAHTLLKDWMLVHQFERSLESYGPEKGNIFHWFEANWREFSRGGEQYLAERLKQTEKAHFFDSHPTMAARVEAMRGFPDQAPPEPRAAHQMIRNFSELEQTLHARALATSASDDADEEPAA